MQIMWILGREFKHLNNKLQWIGYLSSTSVYGNYDGAWVDEEYALESSLISDSNKLFPPFGTVR